MIGTVAVPPAQVLELGGIAALWLALLVRVPDALRRRHTRSFWITCGGLAATMTLHTDLSCAVLRELTDNPQVVHVLRGDGLAGASPTGLARARELADAVGASFHTVVGDDVPEALLEFARAADATQLVVGTSRRSRWARVLEEGIGSTVVQRSGPIDVHMVTHAPSGHARPWRRRWRNPLPAARRAWG